MKIKETNKNNINTKYLLTGKAKEDFIEYHYNCLDFTKESHNEQYELFEFQTEEIHQLASIIDWLDSVSIYVEVKKSINNYWLYNLNIEGDYVRISALDPMQDTRHEATQEAIKKAVEIYNKGAN